MDLRRIEEAAQSILAETMVGGSWIEPLEALMMTMGSHGGGIARTTPPDMFAIPTSGVRQQFADFKAGRCPPLTARSHIACRTSVGFVSDDMAFDAEHRRRDRFYQEFLLPRHCAHQASAFLDATSAGDLNLIAFRSPLEGRFETAELAAFGLALPYLRASAMASRRWLTSEARRDANAFLHRGEPVIYLASDGTVLEVDGEAAQQLAPSIKITGRRISAVDGSQQRRVDKALNVSLRERRPSLTTLSDVAGTHEVRILMLPVLRDAADLFRTTAVLVIVIDSRRPPVIDRRTLELLAGDAHLTRREIEVVQAIAAGRGLTEFATKAGIALETARLHLKAAFRKLDVHTQTELALLVHRLSVR